MRIAVLAMSLVLTGAVLWANEDKAHAETNINSLSLAIDANDEQNDDDEDLVISTNYQYIADALQTEDEEEIDSVEDEELEPDPITHTVEEGESLTAIANEHDTEWLRIWQRNTDIENPDIIHIDQELIIPFADEELEERELPEPEQVEALDQAEEELNSSTPEEVSSTEPTQAASNSQPDRQPEPSRQRGDSSGNLYAPGYCTWYVKDRRPDLPNNLGNANTWVSRASSQGFSTGASPQVGAVAYQPASSLGHVAYVEAVHDDGTVTVSEMNWSGLYVVTERRVSANTFTYIY